MQGARAAAFLPLFVLLLVVASSVPCARGGRAGGHVMCPRLRRPCGVRLPPRLRVFFRVGLCRRLLYDSALAGDFPVNRCLSFPFGLNPKFIPFSLALVVWGVVGVARWRCYPRKWLPNKPGEGANHAKACVFSGNRPRKIAGLHWPSRPLRPCEETAKE